MDTVFRILDSNKSREKYLLEEWGAARKTSEVTNWVQDLNNGVPIVSKSAPIFFYDLDNLTWSGRAMANSVTPALW